jgi:flagellar hook-basal body complex protein FliE
MNEIDKVLGQIKAAQQTLGINKLTKPQKAEGPPQADFGAVLKNSVSDVNKAQHLARSLARDFELGANNVQLHDAMIASQKASISFQAMVQVRNRVVQAYQEIMSMNV